MMQTTWSRILLVNDDPGTLTLLNEALDAAGHDVVCCSTINEALMSAECEPFAVALINMQQPDQTGVELLVQLRRMNGQIRVVLNAAFQSLHSKPQISEGNSLIYFENAPSSSILLNHVHGAFRSYVTNSIKELQAGMATQTASLEEQQARFQQLVEHIQEVFWIALPDHSRILYMSPRYERVWGRNCGTLVDHPHDLWDAVHPQDQEYVLTRVAAGEATGFQAEFRIIKPDQGVRFIRVQTFPLSNAVGEVVRMVGIAEDMTEQKRVQETLVKTERQFRQSSRMEAIGTLAGGIAHDFNNILTAILGYTELGLASIPKDSRTHRNLQEVMTAGHRAKHLVLQILAFSRQSGQGKNPTPMHTVIQEALKLMRATIPSTIEIRHSLLTEASVLADTTQLHQVVVNLCTNAEYAMRETGGLLEVTLEEVDVTEEKVSSVAGLKVGPHVRLIVQDNGTGMSTDVLERMFDPFFTTKEVGRGTGIGLSMSHNFIKEHDGEIEVKNLKAGGVVFKITLPLSESLKLKDSLETITTDNNSESEMKIVSKKVLVVDDEEEIGVLVSCVLEGMGLDVEIAGDGVEALEKIIDSEIEFDLILSDMQMPKMSGIELLEQIRCLSLKKQPKFVFSTGGINEDLSRKLNDPNCKFDGYLLKPFELDKVEKLVKELI